MTTKIVYSNLEVSEPQYVIGPNINPVPSDAINSRFIKTGKLAGSRMMTNLGSKAYAGALMAYKLPAPQVGGVTLPYINFDFDFYVSSENFDNLARLENDIKVVLTGPPNPSTVIPNTYDFSTQFNGSENWMLQIDNATGQWVDAGYHLALVPDTWVHFSFRNFMDVPRGKFSVQSMTANSDAPYTIPVTLQNVAIPSSNWSPVIAVQFQTEIWGSGSCSTMYKNITVTCADGPA
jgi:hypothetical protein